MFSEPIEGRIDDAILYLLLYKALIKDQASEYFSSDGETNEGCEE